jgi:hypothetical protein
MPEEDKAEMRSIIDEYHKHGKKYYNIIAKPGDPNKLRRLIDSYDAKLEVEVLMLEVFEWILKANDEPNNMTYFNDMAYETFAKINDIPEDGNGGYDFPDGSPTTPAMAMNYGWFNYSGFVSMQTHMLGEMAGNFGQADYCLRHNCRKAGDINKARDNYYKNSGRFLEYLSKFFTGFAEIESRIMDLANGKLTETLFNYDSERLQPGEGNKGVRSNSGIGVLP